jgi:DNA-binding PadR family transcriptional regulator
MNSTHTTRQVLAALLANGGEMTGYDIVQATGLQSGTVYPILRRFDDNGLVASRDDRSRGRLRVHYQLTDDGRAAAQNVNKETPKP